MSANQILQITPHLGGGLGRVLINWVREDNKRNDNIHVLACLEKTQNATEDFNDIKEVVIDDLYNNQDKLKKLIKDSDIVIINWFNHPLIYDIMLNFTFPDCRLICYNHVSSLNAPYSMPKEMFYFFDKIVFTTNATYEAPIMQGIHEKYFNKCCTIESAFGTEKYVETHYNMTDKTNHGAGNSGIFNVGYIGTSSYSKLDKNFVSLCKNVKNKNTKFHICSGDSQDHIKKDAKRLECEHLFYFKGRVDNVLPTLLNSHVFGYPLQPKHLGSAEQVFGEMMIFGAVPVAMNNPAERHIITNNVNGILANTYDEYSKAIDYLFYNPDIRHHMGINAHLFAKERYSMDVKISKWNKLFGEVIEEDKYSRQWYGNNKKYEGYELFLESVDNLGILFSNYANCLERGFVHSDIIRFKNQIIEIFKSNDQWYSDNKGGVRQYLKYFPNDKYLLEWEKLL